MVRTQFGVAVHKLHSRREFDRLIRRADELDYDVIATPDHLGRPAPFALLAAAAVITSRLRLRTYMLNSAFWNTAMLAREAATVDVLSDGRFELGLGAGHMKTEFDDAGIAWSPLDERLAWLEHTAVDVRRRLADHAPAPVQQPVPIAIGAMSLAGLTVAARHADIVGFAGLRQATGAPPGTFTITGPNHLAGMVGHVRTVAAGRHYRSDALLQVVAIGEPQSAAESIAAKVPELTVDDVLTSPFVLLAGSPEAAAAQLLQRQETYGIDSWTTHEPNLEAFGEVIAACRAQDVETARASSRASATLTSTPAGQEPLHRRDRRFGVKEAE
jgi:probable F420-dependent oxidoreductase